MQAILRDMNSLRLNMDGTAKDFPEVRSIDWKNPDPELVNSLRNRDVEKRKAAGLNVGQWYGHITSQGKKHVGEIPAMRKRLGEIRAELAKLPVERTFTYRIDAL